MLQTAGPRAIPSDSSAALWTDSFSAQLSSDAGLQSGFSSTVREIQRRSATTEAGPLRGTSWRRVRGD